MGLAEMRAVAVAAAAILSDCGPASVQCWDDWLRPRTERARSFRTGTMQAVAAKAAAATLATRLAEQEAAGRAALAAATADKAAAFAELEQVHTAAVAPDAATECYASTAHTRHD